MTSIDEIITKIQALAITSGDLVLSANDFTGMDFMQVFFTDVLKETIITLAGATRTPGQDTITVTGQAALLGYTSLALNIKFEVQDDQVVGTLTGTFDPGKSTNLPVLTWIKVGDVTLTTSISETFKIVTFGFGMNVITEDDTKIPVSITSMGNDDWRLDVAEGTAQGIELTELVSLLDGEALLSFLPQGLVKTLDVVELNGIETVYNAKAKTISYFTTGVSFKGGWDIAPKVSLLPGLQLNLTIINAGDSSTRTFIANVMGTFMIGTVQVPLQLGASVGGTTIWSFGIQAGQKVTLPSLSSLLDLGNASDALPDGLSNIPGIDINEFRIDFDSTNNELIVLDFSIATASAWPVITGYFEIEKLSIDFQISDLTDSATRQVFGTLYGLFKVGDVELFCALAKTEQNPDWTITAGLPPEGKLDITALAKQLLEPKITVPSDLPSIDFTTLLITVVPGKGTFEFDAESTDEWTLITNKLSITSFKLDFKKDPANAAKDISGEIATTLLIGTVTLSLSASLNNTPSGGWEFTGKTKEGDVIAIGQFLTYLTDTFNVPEPPDWMQSITLKDLSVTLNTATKDFTFTVTADATISDKACELVIQFSLTHPKGSYDLKFLGSLTVGDQLFTLDFDKTGTSTLLGATWQSQSGSTLNLQDLAGIFGNASLTSLLSEIPENMDLALKSLSFTYYFENKAINKDKNSELVLTAVSNNYGDLVFVGNKISNSWVFVFLVAIDKIDLTQLPLIGEEVGKLGKFEIDNFNLLLCSGTLTQIQVKDINTLIQNAATKTKATLPTLPDAPAGLQKGVNLSMVFFVADYSEPVALGTATPKNGGTQTQLLLASANEPELVKPAALLSDPVSSNNLQTQNGYWINIQKAFGPVYMDKIGFAYSDGYIEILFNFALKLGALDVTLDGLMIGASLKAALDQKIDVTYGLQGLSVTFNAGAVEISGGFIKQEVNGITEYNGEALIKVGTFALSALGSYARVDGHTSLFIFAMITEPPLGGPPYFYITGVAAGFGYNRGLVIPTIDQIATFPLVSGFVPGQSSPFSGNEKPGDALSYLVSQNIVPVQIGQDWLAAGIQFTTFEMLQSFALLIVEFGTSLEIAVLGLTTASVPTGDPRPLLFAQLALELRILPDEGLFSLEAKLTSSSYLFDSSCHLTGGFAFYIWFGSNIHAGDFVITLGGYHPHFNKPDYYPDVPRLGFNWVVTSELTIKGGIYFALTPVCIMAGGSLQALWQSAGLKVWFDIGADFLISWKPYHYEIDLYLSFGVSYTFKINLLFATITATISVSLGANLSIWGPAFSGVAQIHLWIISFTVHFGASSSQTPPPIPWSEFEQSFLPAATDSSQQQMRLARRNGVEISADFSLDDSQATSYRVWTLSVLKGLAKTLPPSPDKPDDIDWIVNPEGTVLEARSQIPAKTYTVVVEGTQQDGQPCPVDPSQIVFTNQSDLDQRNQQFGVGPSKVANDDFTSEITVTLKYEDGEISEKLIFYFTGIIQCAPKALWLPDAPDIKDNKTLVKDVLLGFEITSSETPPENTPWADVAQLGFRDYQYQPDLTWSEPEVVDGPPQPADPFGQLETTILNSPSRAGILESLFAGDPSIPLDVNVQQMAKEASNFLLAPPIFAFEYGQANQSSI